MTAYSSYYAIGATTSSNLRQAHLGIIRRVQLPPWERTNTLEVETFWPLKSQLQQFRCMGFYLSLL